MADDALSRLSETIRSRLSGDPATSYVAKLHAKGVDAALKKVGEEAAEFIMAAKDAAHESSHETSHETSHERSEAARAKLIAEAADVWFHMLVALARQGASASDVIAELTRREGVSGIDEKAARRD